jgi:transposase
LIADKGYDSDAIEDWAEERGLVTIIPLHKNRKVQREYDHYIYKLRRLVENAFLKLKEWRGLATRYCKRCASFLAFVQIRCLLLWAKIS